MLDKNKIEALVTDYLRNTDFFLVEVKIEAGDKITIFFDRMQGSVTIEDCVALSKHIETNLDRNKFDYELEVSSPGMDEPFKVPAQYIKHTGKEVKIIDISGKRTDGILKEVTPAGVLLEVTEKIKEEGGKKVIQITKHISFPFESIRQTKRILKF